MQVANQIATSFEHEFIAPEHILLGILSQPCGAVTICESLGIAIETIQRHVREAAAALASASPVPRAKRVIEYTIEESRVLRHAAIDSHHLLLAILRLEDSVGAKALRDAGLS